ncbi:hypothetical protein B0H63DRAFT_519519 [Podospora didyma]|uniref:Secreted protein n=1 Tax=Podospora didyma TaxID=330526 RepID=A0AAE0NZ70_9PEZI|nr:hypothetical protein B0H63DRAFT_519519 [Podospora didyma]
MFTRVTVLANLLAAAFATPVANLTPGPVLDEREVPLANLTLVGRDEIDARGKLAKHAEGVHLVDCGGVYSLVVYCANDSNCSFFPSGSNKCVPPPGGLTTWAAHPGSCTFSTGVTFLWNLVSNAQTYPNYAVVGSASNGFRSFTCRKDHKHIMFYDGNGYSCRSIYYCL